MILHKVGIINGFLNMPKYTKRLGEIYKVIHMNPKIYSFNSYMYSGYLHPYLNGDIKKIVDECDVIHCLSGSGYPIIPYLLKHQIDKPVIFECTPLNAHSGPFLSALNITKDKNHGNKYCEAVLSKLCYPEHWKKDVLYNGIDELKSRNKLLILQSKEDHISCIKNREHVVDHLYEKGRHAQLFYVNDFTIVNEFLLKHLVSKKGGC